MRIQHNISAMNSLTNYSNNNSALSKNLQRLSSGYQINSAADNAAGLAISEKMRSQIKGLEKAQDNANDGISLIQTAEGALTEVNSMLTRLTELATQSANGTYEDGVDRANIQEETDALLTEIDRISQATNFNGITLLDGSLSGAGSGGTALTGAQVVSIKAAKKTLTGATATAATIDKEAVEVDGAVVTVDWAKLSADDQAALKKNWATNTSKADGDKAAQLMQDTINQAFKDAGYSNSITVTAKTSTGTTFTFESNNKTTSSSIGTLTASKATNVGATTVANGVLAKIASGLGTRGTATLSVPNNADMQGKFNMNINGTDFEISTGTVAADGSDIASVLKTAISGVIDNYNSAVSEDLKLKKEDFTVELTTDGRLKVNNGSNANISFSDVIGGSVAKALGISSESSNVMGNGLTLQVGDTNDDYQKVTVSINDMSSKGLGLSNLDVSNQDAAGASITTIKNAVNKVSTQRGKLGALQNRLDHTLNNLAATTENITSSESQIRDTNIAKEMTQYAKNNILSQAAQSMLAQANSMPQGVLQLLG